MDPSSLSCSAPSAPTPLEGLQRARSKADVRSLIQHFDADAINQAWLRLDPLDRAALSLVRATDGEILDVDPEDLF